VATFGVQIRSGETEIDEKDGGAVCNVVVGATDAELLGFL
jgi:hypothetical protein